MWAAIHAQRETRGLQRTLWGRYSPWRLARRHPGRRTPPSRTLISQNSLRSFQVLPTAPWHLQPNLTHAACSRVFSQQHLTFVLRNYARLKAGYVTLCSPPPTPESDLAQQRGFRSPTPHVPRPTSRAGPPSRGSARPHSATDRSPVWPVLLQGQGRRRGAGSSVPPGNVPCGT